MIDGEIGGLSWQCEELRVRGGETIMSERWVESTKVVLEMGGAEEGFSFIVYIDKWSCEVIFLFRKLCSCLSVNHGLT